MDYLATQPEKFQNYLNRLRRYARARGFRILKDWTGSFPRSMPGSPRSGRSTGSSTSRWR
jgi:hypothetical protein